MVHVHELQKLCTATGFHAKNYKLGLTAAIMLSQTGMVTTLLNFGLVSACLSLL